MPNLTVQEVLEQGLARVEDFARARPVVKSVLFRRISLRQQELAMLAARVNRDYFGVTALAQLVGGAADLNDIGSPVPTPETVHHITVETIAGGATVAVGAQVSIVRLGDEAAEEPPRVTIRSGVIRQVGNDLNGVTSLRVHYTRLPDSLLAAEDGTTRVVIPAPYDELLVLAVAERVVDRAFRGVGPDDPARKLVADEIVGEVKEWEAKWKAHVAEYAAQRTRFSR